MIDKCSSALLESALVGPLPLDDEEQFYQHLEHCAGCRAALEQMAGGEAWYREAKAALSEDELEKFIPARDEWSDIDFTVEHLEPADEPNMLGRLGGYDVLEIIGRGGMGVVLKGFDRELKRCVAIKVLSPHLAQSSLAKKRFAREAQAAAAILHPNVLAIHQVQPAGRLPFLVMPLVAGESLAQRLHAQGRLELKETLRIGMQAAAGLAAAHEQGLVHRDVKPANILLEKGVERAVLTDFGLARAADDVSMTRWGMIAGTPQYMSPEQARGEPLDGRSDLFSLGCVLYEMATGVSPFRADSTMATLRRLIDDPPLAMASLNAELPPWFVMIVDRLLKKNPTDRYGSAYEVSDVLEKCLAHLQQPTNVPLPAELAALAPRPTTKSRKPLFTRVAVMLAILGIGFFAAAMVATHPADISGEWTGDDWGRVVLTKTTDAEYTGSYTETVGKTPGEIRLKWSRIEGRFNGTWQEGKDRFGEISLRLVGDEIRGANTTDAKSKINPATPHLADFTWQRGATLSNQTIFGPVIERVLEDFTENPKQGFLDFETGTVRGPTKDISFKDRVKGVNEAIAWARTQKMDVAADTVSETGRGLLGFGLEVSSKLKDEQWEQPPALEEMQKALAAQTFNNQRFADPRDTDESLTPMSVNTITRARNQSRTFLFRTRKGTLGLLQIMEYNDSPHGFVKFRYKLVRQGLISAPTSPKLNTAARNHFPVGMQISHNYSSVYVVGDGVDLHYVLFHDAHFSLVANNAQSDLFSSSSGWKEEGSVVLRSHYAFEFLRKSDAATRLEINKNKFDLNNGRVFVLHADGQIEQRKMDISLATAGDPDAMAKLLGAKSAANVAKLSYGAEKNGLQAALELKPTGGEFKLGEPIAVSFHIRNASKSGIGFESTTWRQDDEAHIIIEDEKGQKFPVRHIWYSGWPILQYESLQPGDSKTIRGSSLAFFAEDADDKNRKHPVGNWVIAKPGRYSVRYRLKFPDVLGNPLAGANWEGELETAPVTIEVKAGGTAATAPGDQPVRCFDPGFRVGAIACSPDGKLIAVVDDSLSLGTTILGPGPDERIPGKVQGGWPPAVKILNGVTDNVITTLKLLEPDEEALYPGTDADSIFEVTALAFSPDGNLLAVGTNAGQVKLFEARSGKQVRSLDDTVGRKKRAKPTGNRASFTRAMGSVGSLAFSPDGSLLATGGSAFSDESRPRSNYLTATPITRPGLLKLWDVKTGGLVHDLAGHSRNLNAIAFSPDGKLLASAGDWLDVGKDGSLSEDGRGVKMWNVSTGEIDGKILTHDNSWLWSVSFSPDSKMLAIGSQKFGKDKKLGEQSGGPSSGTVRMVYVTSGIAEWLQTVPDYCSKVMFAPDGKTIVAQCGAESVQILDAGNGSLMREIRKPGGRVRALCIAPQANEFILASTDQDKQQCIEVWDLQKAAAKSTAANTPSFGPLMERSIPYGQAIDFLSGRIMEWPEKWRNTNKTGRIPDEEKWIVDTGIAASAYGEGLMGHGTVAAECQSKFDDVTAADVLQATAALTLEKNDLRPAQAGAKTLFFRTREGTPGILQIVSLGDAVKKREVQLRYKLVLRASSNVSGLVPAQPTSFKVTKEQVARIEELLKKGPVTTDYPAAIFEHDETSGSSYRQRADVSAIPVFRSEKSSLDFIPLGQVFHQRGEKSSFYVQWDAIGASTRHYYGPYRHFDEIGKLLGPSLAIASRKPLNDKAEKITTSLLEHLDDLKIILEHRPQDQADKHSLYLQTANKEAIPNFYLRPVVTREQMKTLILRLAAEGFFDRAQGDFHPPRSSQKPEQVKNEPGYILIVLGKESHGEAVWSGSFHEDLSLRDGAAAEVLQQLNSVLEGEAKSAADAMLHEIGNATNKTSLPENAEKDAQRDLQGGTLKYYLVGQPARHDQNWQTILKRDYNVELVLLGCVPVPPVSEYARRYNEAVLPELKKKHREDFLNISEEKAKIFKESSMQINSPTDAAFERFAGRLVDYLNKPVAGATVLVPSISEEGKIYINSGKIVEPSGTDITHGIEATTDADGRFEFALIPGSARFLLVTSQNCLAWVVPNIDPTKEILVTLPQPASFVIRYDIPGGPEIAQFDICLNPAETPGWKDKLYNASVSVSIRNGQQATVANLSPGVYDIQRRKSAGIKDAGTVGVPLDWPNRFVLSAGTNKTVNFVRKGETIHGTVADLRALKLAGAMIHVTEKLPETGTPTTTPRQFDIIATGPDGAFETEALPPGNYTFSTSAEQAPRQSPSLERHNLLFTNRVDVTVTAEQRTEPLIIQLTPNGLDEKYWRKRWTAVPEGKPADNTDPLSTSQREEVQKQLAQTFSDVETTQKELAMLLQQPGLDVEDQEAKALKIKEQLRLLEAQAEKLRAKIQQNTPNQTSSLDRDSSDRAEKRGEELVQGFRAPLELVTADIFTDGGTLTIAFKDAQAKNLEFCIDRREETPTAGRLFVGAAHPKKPEAILVASGGKTEKEVLSLLQGWVKEHVADKKAQELRERNSVVGLSEAEVQQLRVIKVLDCLAIRNSEAPQDRTEPHSPGK